MSKYNKSVREIVLDIALTNKSDHIASSLSCAEILDAIYSYKSPSDQVVLSKGHAALALYAALSREDADLLKALENCGLDGGSLWGHPASNPSLGIEGTSGSLGTGYGYALGLAYAKKLNRTPGKIFAILGDGELDEGIVWETMRILVSKSLTNFVTIIDQNGCRGLGAAITHGKDVFEALGFNVSTIDGHDIKALIDEFEKKPSLPKLIIARTIKGKGLANIEGAWESHYWKFT